jgi:ribosomal protein L32
MKEKLNIDFVTEFLHERAEILKLIYGARLTAVMQDGEITAPQIELDRYFETFSTGEQGVLKFIQSPQMPLDFTRLDGSVGRACLDLHSKFWRKRYNLPDQIDKPSATFCASCGEKSVVISGHHYCTCPTKNQL